MSLFICPRNKCYVSFMGNPGAVLEFNDIVRGRRAAYALGLQKPNYPVPAIPVQVHFHISGLISTKEGKGSRRWYNLTV